MTTEDESSGGGSVEQKFTAPLSAVERFHAWKFKGKGEASAGKWAVRKITGVGSSKKQKTPMKACMKDVLKDLEEREELGTMMRTTDVVPRDLQEMDIAMDAKPSSAGPTNLTQTQDETYQKQ
jgi:hypothetical protein